MDPSIASEIVSHLTGLIEGATGSITSWATATFAFLFFVKSLSGVVLHYVRGEALATGYYGQLTWEFCTLSIVIGLYFLLSFPFMEGMRNAGMNLSGSGSDSVDVGEIARQAEWITAKVDETIRQMHSYNPLVVISNAPTILTLRVLNFIVHLLYAVIALISIWLFVKFCFGYLIGGVVIGGIAWSETYQLGMKGIVYVLWSAMPLFLLALIQGFSEVLLSGAITDTGQPATVPLLWDLIWIQGFLVLLSLAVPSVASEFMHSLVGTNGAPDMHKLPRMMSTHGGAVTSTIGSIANMTSNSSISSNTSSAFSSLPSSSSTPAPPQVGNAPRIQARL